MAAQENAEAELAFANTAYEIANETFAYVNEELILRQEEANARALQKERTRVFNMVKSDVKLVSGIVEQIDSRVKWISDRMEEIEKAALRPPENGVDMYAVNHRDDNPGFITCGVASLDN